MKKIKFKLCFVFHFLMYLYFHLNISSNKNGNATVKLLETAVKSNVFSNGYNANGIMRDNIAFMQFCANLNMDYRELMVRFVSIDLLYQTMIYKTTPSFIGAAAGIINLYNPQEVRNINDKYFQTYPLDLNRV